MARDKDPDTYRLDPTREYTDAEIRAGLSYVDPDDDDDDDDTTTDRGRSVHPCRGCATAENTYGLGALCYRHETTA